MVYYNSQIINPEKFRVPNYSISPFSTDNLKNLNTIISENNTKEIGDNLLDKFGNYQLTLTAKDAIFKALSFYNLSKNEEVYIVTTSGNKYVSSCVTNEIEKYCKWSRSLSEATKVIFLIHEFGCLYKDMQELATLDIPIIEDFAMSLFSKNNSLRNKNYADFSIYSLPKFFPVQFGGILKYNNPVFLDKDTIDNSKPFQKDLKKIANFYFKNEDEIIAKRKKNYNLYKVLFENIGIQTRLNISEYETPSVFMFKTEEIDLDTLKVFLQKNGVECSKFYGESAFFLPVHQGLEDFDVEYIVNLIRYFIDVNK